MKNRILFLSSALCVCGMTAAIASECSGNECYGEIPNTEYSVVEYTDESDVMFDYAPDVTPMASVKLLSVKPVPVDNRAPIWDGTSEKSKPITKYTKTVSWKNGVPLWDDSISDYRTKDFRDWMLNDLPMVYLYDSNDTELVDLYNDTMSDAAITRARIEEILSPNRPSENLWGNSCDARYTAQDMSKPIRAAFGDDGCPFETETECDIWRRKPIFREYVSPRSPKIRQDKMYQLLSSVECNGDLEANSPAAAPLLERYKMLMQSARACCTEGMKYSLKTAGASDGLIYKFMADDANFYNIGDRCLMTTDAELDEKYPETATAAVIGDVRNGCLCRGRQWFTAMLAPFVDAWRASPEFAQSKFYWTYTDGLNRRVTVSINDDVQNVLDQIAACP